jgi:hypothetical protein
MGFITGQNEREETTQDAIVTKSAACASYKSNYCDLQNNCKFDRPLRNDFGPLFLITGIKKGPWMRIPRIQAFFNGRSNLQLFCKSQYVTYITATYTRAK